jgi:hypothetical protein
MAKEILSKYSKLVNLVQMPFRFFLRLIRLVKVVKWLRNKWVGSKGDTVMLIKLSLICKIIIIDLLSYLYIFCSLAV